jgi:hypothetical protein
MTKSNWIDGLKNSIKNRKRYMVKFIKFIAACVALVTATQTSFSQEGKSLLFAHTYKVYSQVGQPVNEYLLLGHYDFKENGKASAKYLFYDAKANSRPQQASKEHPQMNAPYAPAPENIPHPINLPNHRDIKRFDGTWRKDGTKLVVQLGQVVRTWQLVDQNDGYYVLSGPFIDAQTKRNVIGNLTYGNSVGHGYLVDTSKLRDDKDLSRVDLYDNYKGEIFQLNGKGTETMDWAYFGSVSLNVVKFRAADDDPNIWTIDYPSPLGLEYHFQSTLLLNYSMESPMVMYLNGGHDYNKNGVLDETAHSMIMWGVRDDSGKVSKILFLEYSWERDGYPLIGVGRYYVK